MSIQAILLDTSFLIALADPARAQHAAAQSYLRAALRAKVPLYLSVITAAEFQQQQVVTDLPLRNFCVLPFNIDHAMTAGELMRSLSSSSAAPAQARAAVRDEVKLIAQAMCEGVSHVLTEGGGLAQLAQRLRDAGRCRLDCILLEHGYEAAWFTGGQKALLPEG